MKPLYKDLLAQHYVRLCRKPTIILCRLYSLRILLLYIIVSFWYLFECYRARFGDKNLLKTN